MSQTRIVITLSILTALLAWFGLKDLAMAVITGLFAFLQVHREQPKP